MRDGHSSVGATKKRLVAFVVMACPAPVPTSAPHAGRG